MNYLQEEKSMDSNILKYSPDIRESKFIGNQTKLACGKPVNFFVRDTGGYQWNKLETGYVASFYFTQKGDFEYQLERAGDWADVDKKRFRGTVRVY